MMATILVVDDASFMRGSLKFIVENAGHEVVGMAKDGKEALKLYRQLRPDVVTLDILMRGTDGLMALEAIMTENPGAKVIMVTALGQEEKQVEARKLGASGYIRKPFKQTEIVDEIERVLANEG
jgi:two-component system chemotaxis response regulator CheY